MRELLFRGKRADNNKWKYGYIVKSDYDLYNIYIVTSAFWEIDIDGDTDMVATEMYIIDEVTVGQYTGLKDKNGQKIFEGDIVKFHLYGEKIGVVKFDYWEFGIVHGKMKEKFTPFERTESEPFEIIGNVFDNPELIENSGKGY